MNVNLYDLQTSTEMANTINVEKVFFFLFMLLYLFAVPFKCVFYGRLTWWSFFIGYLHKAEEVKASATYMLTVTLEEPFWKDFLEFFVVVFVGADTYLHICIFSIHKSIWKI